MTANRRFSPGEDTLLESLRISGLGLRKIATRLGRGRSSIQMRLIALAVRDEREESAPDAVLRAMEDTPGPLPDAVAAAWEASTRGSHD